MSPDDAGRQGDDPHSSATAQPAQARSTSAWIVDRGSWIVDRTSANGSSSRVDRAQRGGAGSGHPGTSRSDCREAGSLDRLGAPHDRGSCLVHVRGPPEPTGLHPRKQLNPDSLFDLLMSVRAVMLPACGRGR